MQLKTLDNLGKEETRGTAWQDFSFPCPGAALLQHFYPCSGFFWAAGALRGLIAEVLYPLFVISIFLLGRVNYLSFYKKHGSSTSRAVVFVSTIGALALGFQVRINNHMKTA